MPNTQERIMLMRKNAGMTGQERIENAILRLKEHEIDQNWEKMIFTLILAARQQVQVFVPFVNEEEKTKITALKEQEEETIWVPIYTGKEEFYRNPEKAVLIEGTLKEVMEYILKLEDTDGLVINPWGTSLSLPKCMIEYILKN